MFAIKHNRARMVEILLKEYNANSNVVNNCNHTALMLCVVCGRGNLSILKLLTKYGFDYAKLVNKRDNVSGRTVFHFLCQQAFADDAIACMKYLFQVCKNIPNCSLNILAKNATDMCGLHTAIFEFNVDMVRYLLENVYFPNNDKSNPNGLAFINMLVQGSASLAHFVLYSHANGEHYDVKRHFKIFKLLVAYGMNLTNSLQMAIGLQTTEIVCFMLRENLCHIYTFENLIAVMFASEDVYTIKEETWKALYKYGIKHNLIVESHQHVAIILCAASINLSSFKMVLSIILAHHGINNLNDYYKCSITNGQTLEFIAQNSDTTQGVKLFIDALISGNESKVSKLDKTAGIQVTLSCVNNHEIKCSTNDNKIVNYREKCSVCCDNSNDDESLSGFQCNECKNFICDDCVIVQKISKKIDMIGTQEVNMYFSSSDEYEASILEEIFDYKSNKKMIDKVKPS